MPLEREALDPARGKPLDPARGKPLDPARGKPLDPARGKGHRVNGWHIITCEYPPDVGGVSDYTKAIAEGLARVGDQVHVWCPRPETSGVTPRLQVHGELGAIRPVDLRRLDRRLDQFPSPRRLLVQWVPHGFGYRSMNVWFCLWVAKRAMKGDAVELMVHEPYIEFRGPLRHKVIACVHRMMTVVLLAAARRVWMSIPAWESRLRPYTLGRPVPMTWLPVPGCVPSSAAASPEAVRRRYASAGQLLIGHFGSYGELVSTLLEARLHAILSQDRTSAVLLIGSGSDRFHHAFVQKHPEWTTRVHATAHCAAHDIGSYIAACDLFVQPYPDGISSRRTSVMACLSHGKAVVSTNGHLTEPFWKQSTAVSLADVEDVERFAHAVAQLAGDEPSRRQMGEHALRLYGDTFAVDRVVSTLKAA